MSDTPTRPTQTTGCLLGLALVLANLALVWVWADASPAGVSEASAQAQSDLLAKATIASLVCAVLATFAWGRSRRVAYIATIASLLLPCGVVLFILAFAGRSQARSVLMAEDRMAPEVATEDGRQYLIHRTLGFRVLAPPEDLMLVTGDAATAEVLARSPRVAGALATWRWASASGGQQFVVLVNGTEQSFDLAVRRRAFDTTVSSALAHTSSLGLEVLEDRHVGEMERVIRSVSSSTGGALTVHFLGYQQGRRFLVVVASGTTMASADLDEVVESLGTAP